MASSMGAKINQWRDEFEANEELRFKFGCANDYIYGRLREAFDADPEIQTEYSDYQAFKSASKKQASELLFAARDKASRDAARRVAEDAKAKRSGVARLMKRMLSKPD